MKKYFVDTLKARRDARDEGGFSLIDVVVTVAIIVALSVGGFVTFNGLINNAKDAAVGAAADQVYTAAVVSENDGGGSIGDLEEIQKDYNESSKDIKVEITGTGDTLSVTATNKDHVAKRGYTAPTGG